MAKTLHVKAKKPWKTLDIPKHIFDEDVFDGLVDVKELTDYEFVKVDIPKNSGKKKRKATFQSDQVVSKKQKIEEYNGETDALCTLKKKKKGKSRKKKICSQLVRNVNYDDIDSVGGTTRADQVSDLNQMKNVDAEKKMRVGKTADNHEKVKSSSPTKKKGKGRSRRKKSEAITCDLNERENVIVMEMEDVCNVNAFETVIESENQLMNLKQKKKMRNVSDKPIKIIVGNSSELEVDDAKNYSLDMSRWNGLFVPDVLLKSIRSQGFQNPTTIQTLALPSAIRDRKDILAAAETGSGKTLAFGIPVIAKILSHLEHRADKEQNQHEQEKKNKNSDEIWMRQCEVNESDELNDGLVIECTSQRSSDTTFQIDTHPLALILEPTRELAVQVHKHLSRLAKYTDIKFAIVVGGMSVEKQRRLLKHKPDIIIATPGRLWQLIEEGDEHLCKIDLIHSLVVDEADRMVEKGHYEELTRLLQMINKSPRCNLSRQSFVMSATLTMEVTLPRRILNKRKEKDLEKDKLKSLTAKICVSTKPKIIDLTPKDKVAQSLTEMRINCNAQEKDLYLYYFLCQHPGRTLVFANSKDCLRRLVSVFNLLECSPYPLHADMQQRQRLKNLDRFSENNRGLLLASDVAARGLDIPNVDYVIHYQVPQTKENYVHRSGRTARASNVGLSVMLVAPEDARNYRKIVHGVKNGEELPILPIDLDLMPSVKGRVGLARRIDVAEHRSKKIRLHNDFFSKAAEEMDMILDNENLIPGKEDSVSNAEEKHRLKQMKRELSGMLKGALAPLRMTKYPTKSGQLMSKKSFDLLKTII